MPRVSILIPNNNSGFQLRDTIEQVLRQTFADWELIVVDGGSTDNSPEIVQGYVRRFPDRGISLVRVENSPGTAPALINAGIERMQGEFFAWLEPGDLYEAEKLEEQVRAFDRQPELALVHTAFQTIDRAGRPIGSFFPPNQFDTNAFTALIEGNFINTGTVLARASAVLKAGRFMESDPEVPSLWRAAGFNHWLKIAADHPIHCLERILYRWRQRSVNGNAAGNVAEAAMERIVIRRYVNEREVAPTPALAVALVGRGLWREAFLTTDRLTPEDRAQAFGIIDALERDQERWDIGDYGNVRRVDAARIRAGLEGSSDPASSRAMLEAVARLTGSQAHPYRAAATRRLRSAPRNSREEDGALTSRQPQPTGF